MKKKQFAITLLSATMVFPMLSVNVLAEELETNPDTEILEPQLITEESGVVETTPTIDDVEEIEILSEDIEFDEADADDIETLDTEIIVDMEIEDKVENTEIEESRPESTMTLSNEKPLIVTYYGNYGYVVNDTNKSLKDEIITHNYHGFLFSNNPFSVGQCTWYAWSRFYQVYGFDSGARGNGKINAKEIVNEHADLFELSNTPATGAVFSMEYNTLYPEYGHVGFVEDFDGEYLWISEGNVLINGTLGNIWVHKVKYDDFMAQFPDVVFAVPKEEKAKDKNSEIYIALQNLSDSNQWS